MPTFADIVTALRREDLLLGAPEQLPEISGLTSDSRSAGPGSLYVAVRGSQTDGHRFVRAAVEVFRPGPARACDQ